MESLPWVELFEGVETKTLMDQPQVGLRMSLVRMAPGAILPFHEHVELERRGRGEEHPGRGRPVVVVGDAILGACQFTSLPFCAA